jgi:hypothetical protein
VKQPEDKKDYPVDEKWPHMATTGKGALANRELASIPFLFMSFSKIFPEMGIAFGKRGRC